MSGILAVLSHWHWNSGKAATAAISMNSLTVFIHSVCCDRNSCFLLSGIRFFFPSAVALCIIQGHFTNCYLRGIRKLTIWSTESALQAEKQQNGWQIGKDVKEREKHSKLKPTLRKIKSSIKIIIVTVVADWYLFSSVIGMYSQHVATSTELQSV